MNALKQKWQLLADRLDELTLRERVMVFAAAAVVLVVLINMLLLDPVLAKQKRVSLQAKEQQANLMEVQAKIQALVAAQSVDPDAENKVRLAQLKQQVTEMNTRLESAQRSLVPPEKMAAVLEDILRRDGQLKFVSLKTLRNAGLNEASAPSAGSVATAQASVSQTATKPAQNFIFRHGVEVTLQGSYADLLHYLAQLEGLPWHMYWGKVTLVVGDYPAAKLTLMVYTLNLDKAWLSI